ncbi:MAG: hypothetical protein ACRDH2_08460, partial [Anaerolineales bacterium]
MNESAWGERGELSVPREDGWAALFSFLRGRGLTVVLVMTLLWIVGASLREARWVNDDATYSYALWLGGACGAALAASRFRGRVALAYSLVLSLLTSGGLVGRVLPSIELLLSLPADELIWGIHVRTFTLLDRVSGWGSTLMRGEVIRDTGLFLLLTGVIVWNASAWLTWCVARRGGALAGLLPLGFLLALNVHLSTQPVIALWLFVLCGLLLVIRAGFARQHADWERRRVDYPDGLGLEWAGSALALALVISLAVGLAPFFGTPKGWRALADLFRRPQQQLAQTASNLFSGVRPPAVVPALVARTPELGVIGAPPDQSADTVFWVQVSDP